MATQTAVQVGTLYLVATPIGNLEDITLRALRTLREADVILAEDTRHSRVLLEHYAIAKRPRALHAHNELAARERVLDELAAGAAVALISDAGTPLVSDPGVRLVSAAIEAGYRVVPIPGASAVLAALTASGIASEPFCFLGFLSRRSGPRKRLLESYRHRPEALVIFESPHRLPATLAALQEVFGDRRACVARELTKLHEDIVRGTLAELSTHFCEAPRGEIALVVEGAQTASSDAKLEDAARGGEAAAQAASDLDHEIRVRLARGESSKTIAEALAQTMGLRKRTVYERVLALRKEVSLIDMTQKRV